MLDMPELEDYRFDPTNTRWLFDEDPDDYWDALEGVAQQDLDQIFGPPSNCGTKAARWTLGKAAPHWAA